MENKELKKYLNKGADIVGAVSAGALGLVGGPGGAMGGVVGVAVTHVVKDVINRQLSNRQEVRVAASTLYMLDGIDRRLKAGDKVREDDFIKDKEHRNKAKELFEGVLLKCRDQYQENMIRFISKIFEETIFDENISYETANKILTIAESLTYKKACIVSFFGRLESFDRSEMMKSPYEDYEYAEYSLELQILRQDIFELFSSGVLKTKYYVVGSQNDIIPYLLDLSNLGRTLFSMMGLDQVAREDIEPINEELKYKNEFGIKKNGGRNDEKYLKNYLSDDKN